MDTRTDPLAFTLDALCARGGLVEQQHGAGIAVLPPSVAQALELPEECLLTAAIEEPGAVGCGLGTALLDRLIDEARSGLHAARVQLELSAPRPARARSLAEAFTVRNGVTQFVECLSGHTEYLLASASWMAQADDSFEGVVHACAEADSGNQPDATFEAILASAVTGSRAARPLDGSFTFGHDANSGPWRRLSALLETRGLAAAAPIRAGAARRHAREYRQITEYFGAMWSEVRTPRRKLDEKTVESRLAAVLADRDSKLRDLEQRFRLRVTLTPVALVGVTVPSVTVRLKVRRRQVERELLLRLPAEAQTIDALACDGCVDFTTKPAMCDARLHVLCEKCVPEPKGRFACPACRAAGG
jgi:GNAT superfamily N-acetyltransferase